MSDLACRSTVVFAIVVLLAGAPTWGQTLANENIVVRRADLKTEMDKIKADCVSRIPKEACVLDKAGRPAGVDENNPAYQAVEKDYKARLKALRAAQPDARFDGLEQVCKDKALSDGIVNSGGKPKNIESDIDMTETMAGYGKKLLDELRRVNPKFSIVETADRWVVPELDMTLWKKLMGETLGSSAFQAGEAFKAWADDIFPLPGGKYKTTGGKEGILDPLGAVLCNIKKAVEAGLGLDPANGTINEHIVGKSVVKATQWTGTKHGDDEFFRQADALRESGSTSWEEAGICRLGDPPEVRARKIREFLDKAQGHFRRSMEAAGAQSQELDAIGEKMVASYRRQGLNDEAAQVLRNRIEVRVANDETMRYLVENDPVTAGRISGLELRANDNGTFTDVASGKQLTPSQVREEVLEPMHRATVKAVQTAESGSAPVEPGAAASAVKAVSTGLLVVGMCQSAYTGAQQAAEEWRPGDWEGKKYLKAWAYGVYYFSGMDPGRQAGLESFNQYCEAIKKGRNPSAGMMVLRATLRGGLSALHGATIGLGTSLWDGMVETGLAIAGDKAAADAAAHQADHMTKLVKDGRAIQASSGPPDLSSLPPPPPIGAGLGAMEKWRADALTKLEALWNADRGRLLNAEACRGCIGCPRYLTCKDCGFYGLHWWLGDRWGCPRCDKCTQPYDLERSDGMTYGQARDQRRKFYDDKRQEILRLGVVKSRQ